MGKALCGRQPEEPWVERRRERQGHMDTREGGRAEPSGVQNILDSKLDGKQQEGTLTF